MSERYPKDNLAQVLNRINTLTKQHETAIPVLTEVFEGGVSNNAVDGIPVLSQMISDDIAKLIRRKTINSILAELQPKLRLAIEQALRTELANSEVVVSAAIEAELLEALCKRLESA